MEKKSERDLRLDFCRGLALIVIFIDHVPGNPIADWTLHNFGFCDAAEVFVLISGISSYLAYASKLERQGFVACTRTIANRWSKIYLAHLVLFGALCAGAIIATANLSGADYISFLRLGWLREDPRAALTSAVTLSFLPKYLDILPLYLVLLGIAPLLLVLIKRDWRMALGLSAAIYIAARAGGINLLEGKESHGWYFNPLTWQFLYTIGMVSCHLTRTSPATLPWSKGWLGVAFGVIGFGFVAAAPWNLTGLVSYHLPWHLWPADKTFLAPLRLINVIALFYVFAFLVRPQASMLKGWLAAPVLSAGRHSLPVYAVGVVLSCAGYVAIKESAGTPIIHAAVNLFGVLTLFTLAAILEWKRTARTQVATPKSRVISAGRVAA